MAIYKRGKIWWYKFKKDGKSYFKSSESEDPEEARRLYRIAVGDVARGKTPIIIFNQVTLDELATDYLADYKIRELKNLDHAQRYVKDLRGFFGNIRVTKITTTKIRQYIQMRKDASLSNGSINRELGALKRMFSLAIKSDPPKVDRIPNIPMLDEKGSVRKGFFEYNEYRALLGALPDYLKPVFTFGYFSGWRIKEILNLKWRQIDFEAGKASIPPGGTKNKDAREIYLDADLLKELKVLEAKRNPLCPYVFQRNGKRIRDFYKAWEKALRACGFVSVLQCRSCGREMDLPKKRKGVQCHACGSSKLRRKGRIFHDLRRTSAREDIRAGIPESIAMKKGGWKTRSVFDRYNITDEKDLKRAAEMRDIRIRALQEEGRGYNRGDNQAFLPSNRPQESIDNPLQSLESHPSV